MELLYAALAVLVGLVGLVYGADRFVLGAASLARNFGVSPLLIGVLVIGLGTSAPEMLVSAVAAWDGNGSMAVGNVVGSNITNIGLVLGVSALVAPIDLDRNVVRVELPLLVLVTAGLLGVLYDASVERGDAIVLLVLFVLYVVRMLRVGGVGSAQEPSNRSSEEASAEVDQGLPTGLSTMWLVVGLLLLLAGSRAVVWGASLIATELGVSDLVIGLTVVAIGTSLPELAASLASALRGHHELAVGNVIGSNIFNSLAVLAIPGLMAPDPLDPRVVSRDYVVMAAMTVVLLLFARGLRPMGRINRGEGAALLTGFVVYMIWLGVQSAA